MSAQPPISPFAIASAGGLLKSSLLASPDGALRLSSEGVSPAYQVSTGLFTPAATPTDVAALALTAYNKVANVLRVTVSGVCTSGGQIFVRLQKSVNGGGGTYSQPTVAKRDINDATASGGVFQFSVNRTSNGDGISSSRPLIDEKELQLGVSGTSPGIPIVFDFAAQRAKRPTLKNLSDWLVVNLNGQTLPSGTQIRVTFEWEETRQYRIGAVGDSTTSNATNGLFNMGNLYGGMGTSGLINSLAMVENMGSNGFRLLDYLNNLNGVTFSANTTQAHVYDIVLLCYGINDVRTGMICSTQAGASARLAAMLDTAIYSILNGTTTGQSYVSPKATVSAITNMSWSANTVTVTCAGGHEFGVGENPAPTMTIAGASPSGYNGVYAVTALSATQFTFSLASNPGAYSSGGTATFSTTWVSTNLATPDAKIILWGSNAFTTDDAGDGPHYYLSASGNTTLSGLWTGMTLAQAAQAGSTILYNAYAAFAGDTRIFALVQKQDVLGKTSQPNSTMTWMVNQIHPGPRGQVLEARQIVPTLVSAMQAVASYIY